MSGTTSTRLTSVYWTYFTLLTIVESLSFAPELRHWVYWTVHLDAVFAGKASNVQLFLRAVVVIGGTPQLILSHHAFDPSCAECFAPLTAYLRVAHCTATFYWHYTPNIRPLFLPLDHGTPFLYFRSACGHCCCAVGKHRACKSVVDQTCHS